MENNTIMKIRIREWFGGIGRVTPCAPFLADGHLEITSRRGLTRPTSTTLLLAFFIIVHSSFCHRALGQSYSVDWYKIAGGGGTSANAQYSLSGTIGQPDAIGAMIGANYFVTGGFWSLYAVQTPGAPSLTIICLGHQAVVAWSPAATGWTLQTNANLAMPTWGNYLGHVVNNRVTNAPPKGNLFFRLRN